MTKLPIRCGKPDFVAIAPISIAPIQNQDVSLTKPLKIDVGVGDAKTPEQHQPDQPGDAYSISSVIQAMIMNAAIASAAFAFGWIESGASQTETGSTMQAATFRSANEVQEHPQWRGRASAPCRLSSSWF